MRCSTSSLRTALAALAALPIASAFAVPPGPVQSPFFYPFSVDGVLEEAGNPSQSNSPYWWVSSGAYFFVDDGVGETQQGPLPQNDYWRLAYARSNPVDTDNGYRPQNIFRMVGRSRWGNARQQVYFLVAADNLSGSPNRNASNGVLLLNRYQDQNNLYYTGLRVDGAAVIKKKKAGVYYTIAYKKVFAGPPYDPDTNPNLLPKNVWMGITSEVLNNPNGSVRIRFHVNPGNGAWTLVFDVVDDGVQFGGAPFTQPGYGGMRTDFMDVAFDNYLFKTLP
jgi:hypothetical protein